MSLFDSINRSIKNIFVGSHKGEDINLEVLEDEHPPKTEYIYTPQPPPGFVYKERINSPGTNDLGIDPNEWFGKNVYPPAPKPEWEDNPRPEEEIADWFIEKPDESDDIEKEKTIHQKMYDIATAKYNPFAIGGSENLGGNDNSQGGSEKVWKHTPD